MRKNDYKGRSFSYRHNPKFQTFCDNYILDPLSAPPFLCTQNPRIVSAEAKAQNVSTLSELTLCMLLTMWPLLEIQLLPMCCFWSQVSAA